MSVKNRWAQGTYMLSHLSSLIVLKPFKAAKAALVNFYETLGLEVNGEVGVIVATHGWIGVEMTRGKFMLEEGAEMQWKEEREGSLLPFITHVHYNSSDTFKKRVPIIIIFLIN